VLFLRSAFDFPAGLFAFRVLAFSPGPLPFRGFSSGSVVVPRFFFMFMRFCSGVAVLLSGLRSELRAAIRLYHNHAYFLGRANWSLGFRQWFQACLFPPNPVSGAFARAANCYHSSWRFIRFSSVGCKRSTISWRRRRAQSGIRFHFFGSIFS